VKYLLEGSARRVGDQVRIHVQLVDAATGTELRAQRYDRQMRDIFKLQDEIMKSLSTTLGLQLSMFEKGIVIPQRTDNLEAYDYFLRGVEGFFVATPDAFARSRKMFEKAIALDFGYADASHASLGFLHWLRYAWQWESDPRGLDRAEELARKAVLLDDSNSNAYATLGWVAMLRNRPDEAIADGERVIKLEPNNAVAYLALADIAGFAGKHEAQLAYAESDAPRS